MAFICKMMYDQAIAYGYYRATVHFLHTELHCSMSLCTTKGSLVYLRHHQLSSHQVSVPLPVRLLWPLISGQRCFQLQSWTLALNCADRQAKPGEPMWAKCSSTLTSDYGFPGKIGGCSHRDLYATDKGGGCVM